MIRLNATLLATVVAFSLCARPLVGQSVRGRVLDAQTDSAIIGARVTLLRGTERVMDVVTDAEGRYNVLARAAGTYRLSASYIGYATIETDSFNVGGREQVVADLRLARTAIPLAPLTIVGRRADPRHEPTEDGLYARRMSLPPIGNSRVFLPLDGEMVNARDARDVLQWIPRIRGCMVVYWNGHLVHSADMAQLWMETPTANLEGIEFYNWQADAPAVFREVPSYLIECVNFSVLALWPRSGRYVSEYTPPPMKHFSWRTHVAPTVQHISGDFAPDIGAGVEAWTQWPVSNRISVGLHMRALSLPLASETMNGLAQYLSNMMYHLPAGDRSLRLLIGGAEGGIDVVKRSQLRVYIGARAQVAHRSFSLEGRDVNRTERRTSAFGWGMGAATAVEVHIRPRLAINAGLTRDMLWLGNYRNIDPKLTRTATRWTGTGLRVGVTYTSAR